MWFILLASSLFSEANVYQGQGRGPPFSPPRRVHTHRRTYTCTHAHTHTKEEKGGEGEMRPRCGTKEQEENPPLPPRGLKELYFPFEQNVDPDLSQGTGI